MKTFFLIFILFLPVVACGSKNHEIKMPLDFFLERQNEDAYLKWEMTSDNRLQACENSSFNNEKRARLFKMIRLGNIYAFRVGLLSFHCWSGGDLGDFYRSSGSFFDQDPTVFVSVTSELKTSPNILERMLVMPSLKMTDNIGAKYKLIKDRLQSLYYIDESQFYVTRKFLTSSLDQRLKKLKSQMN